MKKLLLASLMIILSASLMAQNEEKTRIYILNRLLEAKVENIKYFFHKDYFVKITKKGNIETAQAINIKEISSIKIFDADLDKIEAAVKTASSFMSVGSALKSAGIKYDFTTSMIPMYMIKVSGNTIAICNKKYAAGAEREVKDMAIGLLN